MSAHNELIIRAPEPWIDILLTFSPISVVLIHTHGLATFLMAAANQQTKPSNGVSGLQKITERKSIEFLDIFDRSLDRKIWKHVQKELKRKRSFSEGEISKNYCSKVGQHPHHPLGPGHKRQVSQLSSSSQNVVKPTLTRYNTDIEKCKKQLHGDIRIQVSTPKVQRFRYERANIYIKKTSKLFLRYF